MSDFIGEYFAPGSFFVGAGMTTYRAAKDVRSKGSLGSAWREQADSGEFFKAIQRSRTNKFSLKPDELIDAMYFDTGRYRNYGNIPGYQPGEIQRAFDFARGRSVSNLIDSFGLQANAAAIGITNPSNITREQLGQLLSASPAHVRHLERVAATNSMLGIINMPTQFKDVRDKMESRAYNAIDTMVKARRQFSTLKGKTIRDAVEGNPLLRGSLSPGRYQRPPIGIQSEAQLRQALAGTGRKDLIERTAELFQTVRNAGGNMKMQLLYMNEGAKDFVSGVRIIGNKASRPIDVPIVQRGGTINLGYYGQEKMLARRVGAGDVFDWIQSSGQRGSVSQSLDTALMSYLNDNLGQYRKGGWRSFMRGLQGSYREDVGRAVMPITSNQALNAKVVQQITFRDMPFGPKDVQLSQIDAVFRELGIDAASGLSPTQQVSGIRLDNRPGSRTWGVQSVGMGTGDDKTLAQMMRPKVVTSQARARATVEGMFARKMGDVHAQIRSYSMPQRALAGMLGGSSRFDIGLHEDVAILLDRNIRYQDMRTIRIDANSPMSVRMADMLQSSWYDPFRKAATSKHGVSKTLDFLRKAQQNAKTTELQTRIGQRIEFIERGRKVLQSELLGEMSAGGYVKGSKEGDFFIDRLEYLSETGGPGEKGKGQLILRGFQERALQTGDKTFGWKRVFTGEMNKKEGQYMAALYDITKDMGNVKYYMGMENEEAAQKALQAFYSPYLKKFREHMDATEWRGGLEDWVVPDGVSKKRWRETVSRFADIQAIDAQGLKKINWRTMDFAAHSMISDLANERIRLAGRLTDVSLALDQEANALSPDLMSKDQRRRIANITGEFIEDGAVNFAALEGEETFLQGRINKLNESMKRLGVIGKDGSTFIIDDVVAADRPSLNLVNRFNQTLVETMEENVSHGMHKWSARQMFADLATAEDLTDTQRRRLQGWASGDASRAARAAKRLLLSSDEWRDRSIKALQSQLQFGMQTRSFSVGGNPRFTTGSGGNGSFNMGMMRHMRAQGGVMGQLGIEFAGRMVGQKSEEAVHVYRRMGAFYKGIGEGTKTVALAEMAQQFDIDSPVIDNLFGRNQFARDAAFESVRDAFNIGDGDSLIFDLGEGADNRYIYHPQQISSHTGAFMTPEGRATISGVDKSTKNLIRAYKRQDREAIEEGVATYDEELRKIAVGKKQAPSGALSGKVQGSLRGQAVPQKSMSLFEAAWFTPEEIKQFQNSVGVSESQFKRMLADMGQLDQFDERLAALRAGTEAGVLARQPATELHRISSVNLFSIDQVFERAGTRRTLGLSDEGIMKEIMALDADRFRRNRARMEKDLATFVTASEKTAYLRSEYINTLKSSYDDNALYLPQHMEMILGADYDDDQLDLLLARSKEFNQDLRQRASFQGELLRDGATPEMAQARASNDIQRRAAEDYIYKYHQRELYAGLKERAEGATLTAAELTPGTDAWKSKMRAQAMMAQFEKGYIGQMTNSTDFVREVLRGSSPKEMAEGRLFSEMLLGIMPETALKARQHGAGALMNPEYGLEEGITTLKEVLSGERRADGLTRAQQIDTFNNAFKMVHGESDLVDRLLKFTPDVIDAVGAGNRPENLLSRYLKRDPANADMGQILRLLEDNAIPSPLGEAYRDAVSNIGTKTGRSTFSRHMKNVGSSFGEVFAAIKRHKRPALIGTAIAVGSSMLLGSPGTINESEANAAGARGQHSEPTTPPSDMMQQAPVSTGSGKAIRVRGRSDGRLDMNALSSAIQNRFPGADVSYTMNDYRERINEEYLRKRLQRG